VNLRLDLLVWILFPYPASSTPLAVRPIPSSTPQFAELFSDGNIREFCNPLCRHQQSLFAEIEGPERMQRAWRRTSGYELPKTSSTKELCIVSFDRYRSSPATRIESRGIRDLKHGHTMLPPLRAATVNSLQDRGVGVRIQLPSTTVATSCASAFVAWPSNQHIE